MTDFFFSSRRRHTRLQGDWSSDVCSSDLDAWWVLAAAVAVFGLAGVVKGVVGLGLPTVSMALLALFMPAGQAAAWLLLPSLVTNVVQMRAMPSLRPLLRRLGWKIGRASCRGR